MHFFKELGYQNIIGVDISDEMVRLAKNKNHEVYHINQFFELEGKFDLIIFSHVLEHIEYKYLQKTLELYFERLNDIGKVIILSPVMYDAFFCDVDHIKPYYPIGLINLFSSREISKQYKSQFRLKLMDIYFRKQSLQPYNMRARYINDIKNKCIWKLCTKFFNLIKFLSFNLFSKTTGYCAIFEVIHGE